MLIESRLQLCGVAVSVSDRTLDAMLDHLRDQDLPTILARLADRSEPYYRVVALEAMTENQTTVHCKQC